MNLTPRVGHWAQIDSIDMGALAINGTHYILHYIDITFVDFHMYIPWWQSQLKKLESSSYKYCQQQ